MRCRKTPDLDRPHVRRTTRAFQGLAKPALCLLILSFQQIPQHAKPYVTKDYPCEHLEILWIRQITDPDHGSKNNSRQGSDDHNPCQGPNHPFFFEITINTAGNGHNVEDMIRGTDRGGCVAQKRHLKREEQKCPGNASHGGKQRHHESGQWRQPRRNLYSGSHENMTSS